MIDIESDIFQAVSSVLRAQFAGIFVSGEYVRDVATLPAVIIEEADNATLAITLSSAAMENHASLMYEVNVFSNKSVGRKSEAKSIMAVADAKFQELGFARSSMLTIPNLDDATIYRITARYVANVDQNKTVYRR